MNQTTAIRTTIVITLIVSAALIVSLIMGLIEMSTSELLGGLAIEAAGAFITAGAVYFINEAIVSAADDVSPTDLMKEIKELRAALEELKRLMPVEDKQDNTTPPTSTET